MFEAYIKVLVEAKIKRAIRRIAHKLSPAARAEDRYYDEWIDNHCATMSQRFADKDIKREWERKEEEEQRAKEEGQMAMKSEPLKSLPTIVEEDEDEE